MKAKTRKIGMLMIMSGAMLAGSCAKNGAASFQEAMDALLESRYGTPTQTANPTQPTQAEANSHENQTQPNPAEANPTQPTTQAQAHNQDQTQAQAQTQAQTHVQAPGAAVLVAKGDSILYERYFGIADMATGEAIGPETLFNIASVSKQFTVVGLLQQDIDIDTPAATFFSYPQPFWQEVTLAHLASHSSGIPDSRDRSDRNVCVFADDSLSVSYFPSVDSLKFTPGTAYDYLNPSFILLARVIEQKSGEDFISYMHRHVLNPAGMRTATYFSPEGMPAHTAHGYIKNAEDEWQEYDYGEETFFATRPDGGLYATARDMFAWERALATGRVLSPERLQMAYEPRVNVAESPWCDYQRRPNTWYGLGWFIEKTPGRPVKVYHTGDNGGFQAYVAKYPEEDICVIVLENRNDRDRWELATAIESLLFPASR